MQVFLDAAPAGGYLVSASITKGAGHHAFNPTGNNTTPSSKKGVYEIPVLLRESTHSRAVISKHTTEVEHEDELFESSSSSSSSSGSDSDEEFCYSDASAGTGYYSDDEIIYTNPDDWPDYFFTTTFPSSPYYIPPVNVASSSSVSRNSNKGSGSKRTKQRRALRGDSESSSSSYSSTGSTSSASTSTYSTSPSSSSPSSTSSSSRHTASTRKSSSAYFLTAPRVSGHSSRRQASVSTVDKPLSSLVLPHLSSHLIEQNPSLGAAMQNLSERVSKLQRTWTREDTLVEGMDVQGERELQEEEEDVDNEKVDSIDERYSRAMQFARAHNRRNGSGMMNEGLRRLMASMEIEA